MAEARSGEMGVTEKKEYLRYSQIRLFKFEHCIPGVTRSFRNSVITVSATSLETAHLTEASPRTRINSTVFQSHSSRRRPGAKIRIPISEVSADCTNGSLKIESSH